MAQQVDISIQTGKPIGEPSSKQMANIPLAFEGAIQPRYFCGQLLSDQDLTTLLQWTQSKLRLNRLRSGWGIVNGLHVIADPKNRSGIVVQPGYAIDGHGQDVILACPQLLDLKKGCQQLVSGCEKPGSVDRQTRWDVLVSIKYAEEPINPQTVIATCNRPSALDREYSRTFETAELIYTPIPSSADPELIDNPGNEPPKFDDLVARYRSNNFQTTKADESGEIVIHDKVKEVQIWLLKELTRRPLKHFPFIKDLICDLNPKSSLHWMRHLPIFLFFIVHDQRISAMMSEKNITKVQDSIPLARVSLIQIEDERQVQTCHVNAVLPFAPYRRELSHDHHSLSRGSFNLTHLLWENIEIAQQKLAEVGIKTSVNRKILKKGPLDPIDDLLTSTNAIAYSGSGSNSPVVVLHTLDTDELTDLPLNLGVRVIGFGSLANQAQG